MTDCFCDAVIASIAEKIEALMANGEPLCSVFHPTGCSACNPVWLDHRLGRHGDKATMGFWAGQVGERG